MQVRRAGMDTIYENWSHASAYLLILKNKQSLTKLFGTKKAKAAAITAGSEAAGAFLAQNKKEKKKAEVVVPPSLVDATKRKRPKLSAAVAAAAMIQRAYAAPAEPLSNPSKTSSWHR